jgi:hypothetical protein
MPRFRRPRVAATEYRCEVPLLCLGHNQATQESGELRQEFRGFIYSIVDAATDAEAERDQATPRKGVLP